MLKIVFFASVALTAAQYCDEEVKCTFSPITATHFHYFDFRPLCRTGGGDYKFSDGVGHDYYANVCGVAAQNCLPHDWDNTFERGVAVQMWGSEPTCNPKDPTTMNCVEKSTQSPSCCTRDCQVLGVGPPTYALKNPADASAGVHVTFTGAPPAADDPFWCPWNPNTGAQYPRQVNYVMLCDKSVKGAVPVAAQQNSTDDCMYTLTFETPYACPSSTPIRPMGSGGGGLSGGWIFVIIVVCCAVVYIVGGSLYTYSTERVWALPNRQFWGSVGEYASDGVSYIVHFGKLPGGSSGSAPGASPYDEIGGAGAAGSSASYSAGSGSGYNAEPASTTAYTDL